MTIDTLDGLLEEQLKDLYHAEKQLTKALPKMAKAASDPELKSAFTEHLKQTKGQVARIEQVFELLEKKAKAKPCAAMKGLVEEGQETIQQDASDEMKDCMLIASAQRAEHYEIAAYGTVRTIAEALGNQEVVDLLHQTLEEEKETDAKLSQISRRILAEAGGETEEEDESDEDEVDESDEEDEGDEEEEEDDDEDKKSFSPAPAKKKAPAPAKRKR